MHMGASDGKPELKCKNTFLFETKGAKMLNGNYRIISVHNWLYRAIYGDVILLCDPGFNCACVCLRVCVSIINFVCN